ncbi:MAG: diguanylate cyclase/phosphodiesterase (GGDEF & EAL domains) with PAS/PAC sensor(s) [uncultured Thermomicrobiales bacterium]|uniref:Diguanylate cyclase/phosphodiesterase (GGDEF & EAL domains) with PAS/PAC sensor(S) n=1 Tax=uncultured Thermomicrobiales bacterium TaxID=1645740 RepID=A0A6J4V718_9BACT|nr:MAG: diguanylate cyclase/phosphodiesterase (GGDEF & EAL domains) with PAS/PAC sensor(s) [uncultured Thermomicrobiales bacterium]
MAGLPRPAKLYGAGLTLAALALTVGLLAPTRAPGAREAALAIGCGGLTALAWLHPIPLAFKRKLFLDTIGLVAAVLLLPPGLAALAVGAGTLLAQALRGEDLPQAGFNAAQTMVQAGVTGLILAAADRGAGGPAAPAVVNGPDVLAVTAIAGVSTFVIGNLSVATMIALEAGTPPPRVWYQIFRNADAIEYLGHGAQVALGVVAALLVAADPWTLPIVALPALVIYGLLQRTARLRWRAEAEWRSSEAKLAEAQDVARLGSWEWNLVTGDQIWSDETYRILGTAPQSFRPTLRALLLAIHPDDRRAVDHAVQRALHEGSSFCLDHRVRLPDGAERSVFHQARVVCDDAGRKIRIVGTVQDVTARKSLEARLAHQAFHDPLTGLPNRALLLNRLRDAVAAGRHRSPVGVLFIDLDHFKVINDGLGHEAGDQALVQIGQRLRASLGPTTTVARFGGDEFVVLLDTDSADQARSTAYGLLERLRAPVRIDGQEAAISASIGIALGGPAVKDPGELLRAADTALYRAKAAGRDAVALFEPSMHAQAVERLHLGTALESAVDRGELRLHYQPEVDLDTGLVVGVEALVRWRRPPDRLLLPADFIPLAEDTGLILPIGRWVLTEACRQGRAWQAHRGLMGPLTISVNLSPRQIREPGLVADVERALGDAGLDPQRLKLEVTERLLVEDEEATVAVLRALRDKGVRVVVDDFGAGYSSLGYLRRLPVDTLKIDRSFVSGLDSGHVDRAIVQAITSLAHTLGMDVTAEGIETAEQLATVRAVGCDRGQGVLFAPPLDPAALDEFLARTTTVDEVRLAAAGRSPHGPLSSLRP